MIPKFPCCGSSRNTRWMYCVRTSIVIMFFAAASLVVRSRLAIAQDTNPPTSGVVVADGLTTSEIVAHLEQRNQERLQALREFQGTRSYRIEYKGPWGNHEAEMTVFVRYKSPNDKQFMILSESGSKILCDRVLKGIVNAEKEAATTENQEKTELSERNYSFSFAGTENTTDGEQYVISVTPKTDYKYLYRGKIWIDANDFAATQIQAEPAKNPSFWIKRSEINHRYEKVDEFWLPAEDHAQSWIRMGGQAVLSIDYAHYEITDPVTANATVDAVGAAGH